MNEPNQIKRPIRFRNRILKIDGYKIYAGHCESCPRSVDPWIEQFCSMSENKWYAEISNEYAADPFNYYGLSNYIPNLDLAAELISDNHSRKWYYMNNDDVATIHAQAKQLYGLLHARFVATAPGLSQIKKKIRKGTFGSCPRVNCNGTHLMPVGLSPYPNRHSCKLYCIRCADIYQPPVTKKIDGAYFGPSFPCHFLLNYPEFDIRTRFIPTQFQIFGFGVHLPDKRILPHQDTNHNKFDEEEKSTKLIEQK